MTTAQKEVKEHLEIAGYEFGDTGVNSYFLAPDDIVVTGPFCNMEVAGKKAQEHNIKRVTGAL